MTEINHIDLPIISIIVLSYNTKNTTLACLRELVAISGKLDKKIEIIVIDNHSSDGSDTAITMFDFGGIANKVILNKNNVGFSAGNNIGVVNSSGKYITFVNSDLMVNSVPHKIDWLDIMQKMNSDNTIGALTVRVLQDGGKKNGDIDWASHRGFPTPIRSACYFTGMENLCRKMFPQNKKILNIFGGYHLLHLNIDTEHDIDACTAAFMVCRADVIKSIGGFDESFFMYGEDLDLCFRIKNKGYRVVWYPKYDVLHLKYSSGIQSQSASTKKNIRALFYKSMWIFYEKNLASKYSMILSLLVWLGINSMCYVKTRRFI
jgi:GT2 family glycosyltransferase